MRGISSVITTILMLIITISTVAFYFTFMSRSTTQLTESAQEQSENMLNNIYADIELEAYNSERNSLYVRNTGSVPISGAALAVYVDGSPVRSVIEGSVGPDDVGEIRLLDSITEGSHSFRATAGPNAKSSIYTDAIPAIRGIEFGDGSLNITLRFGVIPTSPVSINISVFNQTCSYPCYVASNLSTISNINAHAVRFTNINRASQKGLYVVVNATRIRSPSAIAIQPNGSSSVVYGICWKDGACNSTNGEDYLNCPSDCSAPASGSTTTTISATTTTSIPTTTTTIGKVILAFSSPTPSNGSTVARTWTEANISMSNMISPMESFIFNWNGTNYSFYDSSLVLAMNFNKNPTLGEDSSMVADISRYGNNATIQGSALNFDGVDDYVNCGNASSLLSSSYSVDVWIKSMENADEVLMSKGLWSSNGWYFYKSASYPGMLIVVLSNSTNATSFGSSTGFLETSNFTHVVAIWNQTNYSLYKNGNPYSSGALNFNWTNSSLPFLIGDYNSIGTYAFNGTMDEVRIYNRSLTATEVSEHYNGIFKNETGLVMYIPFANASGNTATDFSGKGNSGTLYGALKGVYSMTAGSNSYLYDDLPSVSNYVIQSGDYLEYDVYWTSSNDMIAFDYTASDGSALRGAASDQNGINAHPNSDISAYALNRWYHRKIALPAGHVGKTISYYDIACENDQTATKTAYLDNILITNGAGTVRKIIWNGGAITYAVHLASSGALVSLGPSENPASWTNYGRPTWTSQGKYGYGMQLNGIDDYIALPEPPTSSTNIYNGTVMAWLMTSDGGSGYRGIVVKQSAYGIFLRNNYFGAYDWNVSTFRNSSINVADGKWHHVAMTFISGSAGNTVLYVDGVPVANTDCTISSQVQGIAIGAGGNPGTIQQINGAIDEVRVYSRVLSAAEIRLHYQSELKKYNSTQSGFYINVTGLGPRTYTYYGWERDLSGYSGYTDNGSPRYVTLQ